MFISSLMTSCAICCAVYGSGVGLICSAEGSSSSSSSSLGASRMAVFTLDGSLIGAWCLLSLLSEPATDFERYLSLDMSTKVSLVGSAFSKTFLLCEGSFLTAKPFLSRPIASYSISLLLPRPRLECSERRSRVKVPTPPKRLSTSALPLSRSRSASSSLKDSARCLFANVYWLLISSSLLSSFSISC